MFSVKSLPCGPITPGGQFRDGHSTRDRWRRCITPESAHAPVSRRGPAHGAKRKTCACSPCQPSSENWFRVPRHEVLPPNSAREGRLAQRKLLTASAPRIDPATAGHGPRGKAIFARSVRRTICGGTVARFVCITIVQKRDPRGCG